MLDALWSFLRDPANRETLGWISAGIAAVAGGLWAVIRFFAQGGEDGPKGVGPKREVKADRGGVAIGGNAIDSPINAKSSPTNTRRSGKG